MLHDLIDGKASYRFLNDTSPRLLGKAAGYEGYFAQSFNAVEETMLANKKWTAIGDFGDFFRPLAPLNVGADAAALKVELLSAYESAVLLIPELVEKTEFSASLTLIKPR